MNKIRGLAQAVGFVTLGLLALYGLLTVLGGTDAFGLAVRADADAPNTSGQPAALMGGTIPQTMNYQGFVRAPDGSPVSGPYTITARIYVTATGGTAAYETTVPSVTVRDGLFNIVLGDNPPMPVEAFADVPRYIGIDLNDGGGELIPRQRLHAVPWALTAMTLVDDATVNGLSSSGDVSVSGDVSASGNVSASGDITFSGSLAGFYWSDTYVAESPESCGSTDTEMTDYDTSFCWLTRYQLNEWTDSRAADWASCEVWARAGIGKWVLTAATYCDSAGNNPRTQCKARCLGPIRWRP